MTAKQVLFHAGAILIAAVLLMLIGCSSPAQKAEKAAAKLEQTKIVDKQKTADLKHPLLHMDTTTQIVVQPIRNALIMVNVVAFVLFLCSVGLLLTPLAAVDKIALPVTGVAAAGSLLGIVFLRLAWPISIAVGVIVAAAVGRYVWKYRVVIFGL